MKTIFRITALLEGLSYLALLFLGVPMKYLADDPSLVKALGMPHGILFVAYIILAFAIKDKMKWNGMNMFFVLAASIIPFGTFWVDRKWMGN